MIAESALLVEIPARKQCSRLTNSTEEQVQLSVSQSPPSSFLLVISAELQWSAAPVIPELLLHSLNLMLLPLRHSGAPVLQCSLVLCHLRSLRKVRAFAADLQTDSTTAAGHQKGQPPPVIQTCFTFLLNFLIILCSVSPQALYPGRAPDVSNFASLMPSGLSIAVLSGVQVFHVVCPLQQGRQVEIKLSAWWFLFPFSCIIHHLFLLWTQTP